MPRVGKGGRGSHPAFARPSTVSRMWYKHHVTVNEYKEMMERQNGLCAICEIPLVSLKPFKRNGVCNGICIDHDHKTKRFRGLLCNDCNTAIGFLHDNPHLAVKASIYLTRFWS